MGLRNVLVAGAVAAASITGFAQVTGSGSTNTVPKFTGSSTIGNSAITEVNGNVGIGTTSPMYSMDVIGQLKTRLSTMDSTGILAGYSASSLPQLQFNASDGSQRFRFQMNDINTNAERLSLYAGPLGQNTNTETLVVGGNGNVGIGTPTPSQKLHIVSGNNDGIMIGNYNDSMGWNGTGTSPQYSIRFAGYRDIAPNFTGAKIAAIRTNQCCNALAQGMDLGFFVQNGIATGAGDSNLIEAMRIDNGNVGIGTSSPGAKLEVSGNIKLTSGIGASMTYSDGTVQSTAWNGTTCGGDYAESVDVTGDRKRYEAGDVLVIDADTPDKFLHSSEPYSRFVAGIYSTRPGLTGRREGRAKTGEEVPMAMLGIVPTKVSAENGAIRPGDLLVSSATEGYAMKGTDKERLTGAIIGKAMGTLATGKGVIEVLVSLQ